MEPVLTPADSATGSTSGASANRPDRLLAVVMGVALWGLWWLANPYLHFNVHDGSLYSGEALRRLEMHNFAKDVFFMGQTQGNFSLFGSLYAQVVSLLGLPMAGWVMSTTGRVLWWIALYRWVQVGWGERRWWAFMLMLLLPATYDGHGLFAYAGSEVTARCWAEAAVLWALGQQSQGRIGRAWLGVGLAAALHPLIALPGGGLVLLMQPARVRVMGIGVGLLAVLGGAAWGVDPLARLFQTFDPVWWESVLVLAGYALAPSWPALGWAKPMVYAVLLAYVGWGTHSAGWARTWARALLVLLLGLLATWWWACQSHNVLLVQLQVWRVLWLAQLLAPALWVCVLPAWPRWNARVWAHVLLVAAALLSLSAPLTFVIWPALLVMHGRIGPWLEGSTWHRSLPVLAGMILLMALAVRWPALVYADTLNHINHLAHARWVSWAKEPMVSLPVALLLFVGLSRARSRWVRAGLVSLALVPGVLSLSAWSDQVARAQRPLDDQTPLRQIVPEGALVYWDAGSDHTWFRLHRSQYASKLHGPNSLFSREAAMEFRRRLEVLARAGMIGAVPEVPDTHDDVKPDLQRWRAQLEFSATARTLEANNIVTLCQDPILDYVLLSIDIPEADARVPYRDVPSGRVSVFKCPR